MIVFENTCSDREPLKIKQKLQLNICLFSTTGLRGNKLS